MLRVSDIVKDYETSSGDMRVLDGISFEVSNGEILGITGKSGSGKTTLLKILRGAEPFNSGGIELDDSLITNDSADGSKLLGRGTAIHFQRNFGLWNGPAIENLIRRLNSHYVGYEALPEPDAPHYDELYERSMAYLRLVGLEKKALHSSNLLSGGEKQRLIVARQLAAQPRLLLLDEPVTMTGPDTKQEVMDVILQLKDRLNIPIIVVSHLPEVHTYLADRVIYIEDGKVVEDGEPEVVLKNFLKDLKPREELSEPKEKIPCIKASNISKRLALIRVGEVLNIKDQSLEINKGEIVSFIGSSGAGKTTFLKIMEGLKEPKEGEVAYYHDGEWVDMSSFTKQRLELWRKISIMHQEFSLSPHSTIRQQIGFRLSMKMHGALEYARQKAEELNISDEMLDIIYKLPDMGEDERAQSLNQMRLSMEIFPQLFPSVLSTDVDKYAGPIFEALDLPLDVLDKTTYQISGGEHVRAYIALALATSPEILMLDEPFGDLDPVTLRDVTNSLKRINAEFGTTIVLVSHHMDFVKEVAHRAVLFDNGSIIMDGDAREVCQKFIEMSGARYLEHTIEELAS
ncbi:ATP-binding cassette domain-containing protein [Methanococcoides methylutens]|uniref:Putative ABC transporter ATP-binding protein n=1 Tax=Methanococcoides methylutens MM1 TaxID=1434104 RepID=A0A0E3X0T5_METMT|nr:ATP-binding cassette domain-containing protein [Methanococcoides methylutens]AKB86189.1 putative ABC transporter ATP-binding protein [Methanococcoides methylutens MM1]